MSFSQLLDLSLPYAEVSFDGEVCVAKAASSGGVLNLRTCAQQLLYEIGDPAMYITPDVVIDIQDVLFHPLSSCKVACIGAKSSSVSVPEKLLQLVPKDCGWKGWGEISYGGYECFQRAKAAEFLVRSWMEETVPGVNCNILSYIIGLDSLKATSTEDKDSLSRYSGDIRLRMDGRFQSRENAFQFVREFTALYTNGPAGGGGISTGHKKEIILEKQLVKRESVFWQTGIKTTTPTPTKLNTEKQDEICISDKPTLFSTSKTNSEPWPDLSSELLHSPAPPGKKIRLYDVAHSRAGDKGNDLNFSIIPHFPPDIERLKLVITHQWVKSVVSNLQNKKDENVDEDVKVEIYEVKGIHSLNVVVRNILDGGVNCSRRIDRHGKTISDLILCQQIVMP